MSNFKYDELRYIEGALERIAGSLEDLVENKKSENPSNEHLINIHIEYLQMVRRIIFGDKGMFEISRSLRNMETKIVKHLVDLGYTPDKHGE